MCSAMVEKFYIVLKLEDCLSSDLFNSLFLGGFKFFKVSKGRKVSDYICYASNRQCALPSLDVIEMKLFEMMPLLKDFIKVNVAPHGFTISMFRSNCFLSGLTDVELLGKAYGFNSMFTKQVFLCSGLENLAAENLTQLRLELVKDLLKNVVVACGGTFNIVSKSKVEVGKLHITYKNDTENGSVDILVGRVLTDMPDHTIRAYQRLRMDDITTLCDHKLDDTIAGESIDKIVNASTIFDLLQHNIQRSITLNLCEKDIDKRTSCKGPVFILYNYARLFSLCARFDEEVSTGIYPKLPELRNTDFSVLTADDEWQLMFDLILYWPSILKKSIIDIKTSKPKLYLIFEFLKKIATDFSRYYRKTRVLMEPRNHLIPVLFARMHLLKSLLQVYQNIFELINVTPLQKM